MTQKELKDLIYNRKTIYSEGYTVAEVKQLCQDLGVNEKKFSEAMGVNTVMIIDNQIVTFPVDIYYAASIVLNNLKQTLRD